jgi:hypothetical protein
MGPSSIRNERPMTMEAFQRAMCDLVASPDLCIMLVQSPEQVLGRYDLSDRDRRRLLAVVQQPGMLVNCSLYRANRLSPIYSLVPHTCFLLGDALLDEATEFWKGFKETRMQFHEEAKRFGDFLRRRIEMGLLENPLLAEVIDYELALNEFRYTARLDVLSRLALSKTAARESNGVHLHPLIRVLLFRHEPRRLLGLLDERRPPPYELAEGEFWLLLDGTGEEVEIKMIDPGVGRLLKAIEAGNTPPLSADDIEAFIEAGLTVPLP